jgi:hypothetical protein
MGWLIFGRGEIYKEGQVNTVRGKILKMLDDMDEDQQRDILKSIEKGDQPFGSQFDMQKIHGSHSGRGA